MMAVTLKETPRSRKLNYGVSGGGGKLEYFAKGSMDQVAVYNPAVSPSPGTFNGFIRQDVSVDPLGGPHWLVTVEYGPVGQGGGETPAGETPTTPDPPGGSGGTDPVGAGFS